MRGIARLAHELGISTGTVSRALNGKPDVSESTRKRVLETARRLGYAPNHAARALAQGVTRAIGFMIELAPETASTNDYFFMGVFDGMQSILREFGLDLLVLPCASNEDHYTYLERVVSRSAVDGMILASTHRVDRRIELLQSSGIPFVTLGRSSTGEGYSWIDLDFEGVANALVDRLVSKGHRRIAVTVPPGEINHGPIFRDAYREALARNGIAFDPALVFATPRHEDGGEHVIDEILGMSSPPTAIVLLFELTAIGVYRRLRELGIEPGKDFAVTSFRNEPSIRFLSPPLTCYDLSLRDLGKSLARALLAQIPPYADAFPQGIVQARTPMFLKEGESDACGPDPHHRLRPARKQGSADAGDAMALKD